MLGSYRPDPSRALCQVLWPGVLLPMLLVGCSGALEFLLGRDCLKAEISFEMGSPVSALIWNHAACCGARAVVCQLGFRLSPFAPYAEVVAAYVFHRLRESVCSCYGHWQPIPFWMKESDAVSTCLRARVACLHSRHSRPVGALCNDLLWLILLMGFIDAPCASGGRQGLHFGEWWPRLASSP